MPPKVTSLDDVAEAMGYESEEHLLRHLYKEQGWSLNEISRKIGFSRVNIRNRLLRMGVVIRSRGGNNQPVRFNAIRTDSPDIYAGECSLSPEQDDSILPSSGVPEE